MVVPGPVTSAMSVGAHEFLREFPDKARLVTGVAHVLEEVGRIGADLAPLARGPQRAADALDDDARSLLEALPRRGAMGVDRLSARAGVDVRTALRKLSLLEELSMVVRRDDGYALTPPPAASTRAGGGDAGLPGSERERHSSPAGSQCSSEEVTHAAERLGTALWSTRASLTGCTHGSTPTT